MRKPKIQAIEIDGFVYHVARDESAWREESRKRWWFVVNQEANWHMHHVMGRYGILKYMVENSCPILASMHMWEKSGDKAKVDRLQWNAMDMIRIHWGIDLYHRLQRIQRQEKAIPKYLWELKTS